MSVYFDDKSKVIKAVAIGFIVSVALTAVLLCLTALILNMVSGIPYSVIDYAVIALEGVSVLIGSYTAAAIMKSKGIIIGLLPALLLFVLNFIFSMCSGAADIGALTLIKAAVLIICGIAGGIIGVNRKEKIHIH